MFGFIISSASSDHATLNSSEDSHCLRVRMDELEKKKQKPMPGVKRLMLWFLPLPLVILDDMCNLPCLSVLIC